MKFVVGEIGSVMAGRYQLEEHILTTEMSSVVKAWDKFEQRFVVIKITKDTVDCPALVRCLEREAEALQQIDSHRVVRFFDSGKIGASYFIVLEYIQGKDLFRYTEKPHTLSIEETISVGIDILEGLEAIHKAGVVHRDIKLENLITTRDGVKIIDLGLAVSTPTAEKIMDPLDNEGRVCGTPPYLSPEQACGKRDLDGRSDLYACGVVLYELLTGNVPFYKYTDSRGRMIKYWDPLRPFSEIRLRVRVPDNVQEIIWKALKVDPKDRYQTAEEMRTALLSVSERYVILPLC
jgi:serine/threonine-protein kinase